jgi:hypothetical protein
MNRIQHLKFITVILTAACVSATYVLRAEPIRETTASVIALVNLDQQIAQMGEEPGVEDLLLLRSQFMADYDALDRANALAEHRIETSRNLLLRARIRAARHCFAAALADLSSAERRGAALQQVMPIRASILIATGQ